MTAEKNSMIIVQKSGYMGSRKPCDNCGKCKKKTAQNNNRDDDEDDEDQDLLEPLLPYGVDPDSKRNIKPDANSLEPMFPVGVEQEN